MLTVKLVYNSKSADLKAQLSKFDTYCFNLETYDEEHYKERKIGFKIKGSCSAKALPFVAIYDKGELVKAFYSEAGECTCEIICKWIYQYLLDHAYKGGITITKLEGTDNHRNHIGDNNWGSTTNFVEGLPLYLGTVSHWYQTSNVIEIDWENNRFKTKNSTYSFKLHERTSNQQVEQPAS